jgi:hypothetical protein
MLDCSNCKSVWTDGKVHVSGSCWARVSLAKYILRELYPYPNASGGFQNYIFNILIEKPYADPNKSDVYLYPLFLGYRWDQLHVGKPTPSSVDSMIFEYESTMFQCYVKPKCHLVSTHNDATTICVPLTKDTLNVFSQTAYAHQILC